MEIIRLYAPMDFRVDNIPEPVCGAGEVKIKSLFCGLCGSDRPRALDGKVPFYPNTLGHEFTAEVVEVGEGVKNVKVGDHVAVIAKIVCLECEHCKNGNFGQCEDAGFIGLRVPDSGGFAKYNVVPERNVIKLPEGMDLAEATLIEPASVAIHAIFRTGFVPGHEVAVIGAGTIGLLLIQCLKAMGALKVHVFDVNEEALKNAEKYGADFTYNTREEGFLEEYKANTGGYGCLYVLEAVGIEPTVCLALDVAKVHGSIGLVGQLEQPVGFTYPYFRKILEKELQINGCWMQYGLNFPGIDWDLAMKYIAAGKINVKDMIYKIVPSKDVQSLFEEWKQPASVKGKMIVDLSDLSD